MRFFQRASSGILPILAGCVLFSAGAASCAANRTEVAASLSETLATDAVKSALAKSLCETIGAPCTARVNDVQKDLRAFYQSRNGEPVWVNGRKPVSAATIALSAFNRAAEHGLDPERYGATALKNDATRLADAPGPRGASPEDLAAFESRLTSGLLALGRDVAIGRPGPSPAGVGDRRRSPPDIAARLASVIDEGDLAAWPDDVRPVHPQYAALQAALAASPDPERARVLALNLERWRWMPDDLGAGYVLVNVPSFHLWVYEHTRPVFDSKVIVGKLGDETPIFSANMTNVIFSPYWNIPESIAEGETVPSIMKNPEYLAKNKIEVLRRSEAGVERVDPASVDWNNTSETSSLSLRQKPGPGNALGNIKFLLPNRHNVYLHDTPSHSLFNKTGRALSHGCVRVQQPVELARYILRDEPKWTEDAIRRAMNSGDEQGVKLKEPLPVHIVYFTAWAEPDGQVTVLKDVYSRDRRIQP